MNYAEEWLTQAEYDMETAFFMFDGGRHFYAVFMCHLALEKALKGLYRKRLGEAPPKTHDLLLLIKRSGIKCTDDITKFLIRLNQSSIATRYPENLNAIQKQYPREAVAKILQEGKRVLEWIITQ